jgi:hypothetical protein
MMKTLLITVAALVALAAPASAAVTPIDLGTGLKPSVAVDPAGTAHILYLPGTFGAPQYCRLPRRATACDVRSTIAGADHAEQVEILRRESDGVLIAVAREASEVSLAFSSDGGATFTPAVRNPTPVGYAETFTLAPGGQSVLAWAAGRPGQTGLALYNEAFAGADPRIAAIDDRSTSGARKALVATLPDGRILAGAADSPGVTWRLFGGGDPLDVGRWGKRGRLRGNAFDADLSSGPRGTFLVVDRSQPFRSAGHQYPPFYLRSFDAKRGRWSRETGMFADRGGDPESVRATQDASGRLHVLTNTDDGGHCLMYARTGPKKTSRLSRTNVLVRTARRSFDPRLAAAPDGGGAAVWYEMDNDVAQAHVWAAPLQAAKGTYRRADIRRWKACRS